MTSFIHQHYDIGTGWLSSFGHTSASGFIAGAELEIEAVGDWSSVFTENNRISVEQDGSLRNNGREFLLPPSKSAQLVTLFKELHESNIDYRTPHKEERFTERTSIHVHVNCMWSTEEQVKDLLLLYAIVEPIFMSYVGHARRDNIHCMPLFSTHMPSYYGSSLKTIRDRWHKYTALNLLPLSDIGTVEFRHMYGTDDVAIFKTWLSMLETLWVYAQAWGGLSEKDLLSTEKLQGLVANLLTPDYFKYTREHPYYKLEDNLLDVKLAFL